MNVYDSYNIVSFDPASLTRVLCPPLVVSSIRTSSVGPLSNINYLLSERGASRTSRV